MQRYAAMVDVFAIKCARHNFNSCMILNYIQYFTCKGRFHNKLELISDEINYINVCITFYAHSISSVFHTVCTRFTFALFCYGYIFSHLLNKCDTPTKFRTANRVHSSWNVYMNESYIYIYCHIYVLGMYTWMNYIYIYILIYICFYGTRNVNDAYRKVVQLHVISSSD